MKKISVDLFGGPSIFGGKENPLRAEIIYCDNCDNCSVYKSGKCYRVTRGLNDTDCFYGKKEIVKGYTSKARKFYDFKSKYTDDETYNKVSAVSAKHMIGDIGSHYFLDVSFVYVDANTMKLYDPYNGPYNGGRRRNFIEKEKVTGDFIYELCMFKPHVLMGGQISSYQKEVVPEFLYQLSLVVPELYKQVVEKYPELADIKPNHVGKYAKIKTLKRGCTVYDGKNKFIFDGEKLICDEYTSAFLFNGVQAHLEIPVTDGMTTKITSELQLCEETEFV